MGSLNSILIAHQRQQKDSINVECIHDPEWRFYTETIYTNTAGDII